MDNRLQTVAFQLDLETFDQLWNAAKGLGISIDEILKQAVSIWLSQRDSMDPDDIARFERQINQQGANLSDAEAVVIKQTLEKFNGNKSKAAEALGISTRTLYRRLEKIS
jgi:DNA-binding NtrC family response regulator